jgi:hypothetical protein
MIGARTVALTLALAVPTAAPTAPMTTSHAPARYVIVVGYNGPTGGERAPLSWADDDAVRMFRQLADGARRAWLLTTFDTASARIWGPLVDIAQPPRTPSSPASWARPTGPCATSPMAPSWCLPSRGTAA